MQRLHLIGPQALKPIQRPIQVLRQHIGIKAATGQPTARIPTRKVRIRSAGAVEVAAARDVEHAAPHGEVHGRVLLAVEGEQGAGRVGAEDGRGGLAREGGWPGGAVELVGCVEDGGEDDDVEGREEGCAARGPC